MVRLDQKIFMHSEKYGHFDRLMHVLDNKKRALNDQDNKGDRKNAKKKVNKPSRSKMYRLQNALSKAGASDFEMILHASVPIIKFQLNKHFCDICVDNPLPTYNTGLLRQYASLDQRVSPLAYAVKRWAKLNDIASSNMGSLSSYAYVLMVIHFLQQCKPAILPNLQDKTLSPKPMVCARTPFVYAYLIFVDVWRLRCGLLYRYDSSITDFIRKESTPNKY